MTCDPLPTYCSNNLTQLSAYNEYEGKRTTRCDTKHFYMIKLILLNTISINPGDITLLYIIRYTCSLSLSIAKKSLKHCKIHVL